MEKWQGLCPALSSAFLLLFQLSWELLRFLTLVGSGSGQAGGGEGTVFQGGAVLSHEDPSASGFAGSLPQSITSLEPLCPDSDGPLAEFGEPRACTPCLWNDVQAFWGRTLPPSLPMCLGGS